MKHLNFSFVHAALLLTAMLAASAGCGEQADQVLSLSQEETAADETQNTPASEEQTASAEAEGDGTVGEQETADVPENPADGETFTEAVDTAEESMAVYICGAVIAPGVYEVPEGTRLVNLLELAGGFAADADETFWNLAQKLADGAMYYIPTTAETADETFMLPTGEGDTAAGSQSNAEAASSGDSTGSGDAGGSESVSGQTGEQVQSAGENSGTEGLISINTATQDELTTLPGIGATKAAAIITYRETNGPFTAIDEIMNVTGIGESTYEKLKDYICL